MIQDIQTAKKDNFCDICRYCLYEDDAGGFVCHNEKSVMYGEYLSDIGNEDCNKYQGDSFKDMSLKEALAKVTGQSGLFQGISYMLSLPGSEGKPLLWMAFENNTDALEWRSALTRLFAEYMELAKKDGDFNDE